MPLTINIFYIKSLINIGLPLTSALICCLLLILESFQFSCLNKKLNHWFSSHKNNITSILLVILVYFSQTVLQTAFSMFQCRNLYRKDQPEYYILLAPNLQCFTETHKIWLIALAIPIIILWGIAVPLYLALMIKNNKNKLDHHETQKKLYFIVKGYKKTFPSILWESYYIIRKLTMVLIVIFISLISVPLSINLCIITTIIALLIQIKYKPFTDNIPNTLEELL